jgi:hypothetical protein
MPSFDRTPDAPESFGFKVSWFAVRAADPASVLDALELEQAAPANWASGIAAAYGDPQSSDSWVFVSPPIGGWVLVVGSSLPYPATIEGVHNDNGKKFDMMFCRLMQRFEDVQFFGSHRVVDFVTWARALNGKPIRIFGWCGSDGTVLANAGEQTPEEAKLGFVNLTGLSPSDAVDKIFAIAEEEDIEENRLVAGGLSPREARTKIRQSRRSPFIGEIDVVDLAALWSIDPSRLEDQDHPLGLGLAVRLPENLRQ